VTIAPWLLRNRAILGRWALTTDSAHILWLGNNPHSNGTYTDDAGLRNIEHADPAFLASIAYQPELVQQDRFRAAAWRFIREQPGRFLGLCGRRLRAFVWFSPNAGALYSPALSAAYRGWYVALLILGIAGFLGWWQRAARDRRDAARMLWAAVAGLALIHTVVAVNLKHRVPLEVVLSIFAADALWRLGGRR
jgi:hypothetical protein